MDPLEKAKAALAAQAQDCQHAWEPISADDETYEVRCTKCGVTQRRRFDADAIVVPPGVDMSGGAG